MRNTRARQIKEMSKKGEYRKNKKTYTMYSKRERIIFLSELKNEEKGE